MGNLWYLSLEHLQLCAYYGTKCNRKLLLFLLCVHMVWSYRTEVLSKNLLAVHFVLAFEYIHLHGSWGRFSQSLKALKIPTLYKNCIFQYMGRIFCVKFQRYPLKFHTKYLNHASKDVQFIRRGKFTSSNGHAYCALRENHIRVTYGYIRIRALKTIEFNSVWFKCSVRWSVLRRRVYIDCFKWGCYASVNSLRPSDA